MNSLVFNYKNASDFKRIYHVPEFQFYAENDFGVNSNINYGNFINTQNYSLNYLGLWQDYNYSINDNIDFNYLVELQIQYKIVMNEKENFDLFLGYNGNKDFTLLTYHKSHLDFTVKTYEILYKETILFINNEFLLPEPLIKYRYFIV